MDSSLKEGSGGVFIITLDGNTIYDKKKTGRFPSEGEIIKLLKTVE